MRRRTHIHSRRRRGVAVALVATLGLGASSGVAQAWSGSWSSWDESDDDERDDDKDDKDDEDDKKSTGSETSTSDSPTWSWWSTTSTTEASTTQALDSATVAETTDTATTVHDGVTSLGEVVDQIGADDMWAAGYTGAGIDVAVIDTGVAPVAELSTTDVFVGPDLSFEGRVDGVAGLDTYGHGTHMAGIIAGRTPGADPLNPQPGDFLGVAPDAGLVSVKVADHTGAVDVSQVIAAIDWVVQHRNSGDLNIRVLNLSYNTTGTQSYVDDPLSKAIENAWNHGIVVVTSAGNEGMLSFGLANPATNPHVLAVSAAELTAYGSDEYWSVPWWAPSGDMTRNPDVLAPGVSVTSLRVPGSRIDIEHTSGHVADDDRLFKGSGTSQSAAVVSGAAALLLQQRPDLTPDQVKTLLMESAESIMHFDIVKGHGVVDLAEAMHASPSSISTTWAPATGLGSLEAARGDDHVEIGGEPLVGEITVTGATWDPVAWVAASESTSAWTGEDDWSGSSWSGSSWSGSSWSGSSWSGSSWSGSSWSGSSWSGSSWSGSSWSGSSWSGSSWSGSSWSGSSWSGSSWSGSSWSGACWE
ncbi:MAG: S8 family serine peptidase [Ilumatobacter sp.]|uniref:S8 family serine peptidase n=1 Tax=Ilumatobacter sp. TaxID=1967498 RepID=UPI00261AB01B|nr:S8 family serine peptidase [Ilumatobacter sp.]MDJ0769140.1 S8 family serine peptidase [Ilumatobacter sp.]